VLPQFKNAQKVNIVQADAYDYAQKNIQDGKYDFVFTDLWHDVSDGIDLYLKMKEYEKQSPNTIFSYWIEKSILCYL
jgi:spermidine synthase